MGCEMLALVDTDDPAAGEALAHVPEWFADWEHCLSRFQADSELTRLNQSHGQPVRVSDILWDVLDAALTASQQSGGLVTPTLLTALEAAGYDHSFDEGLSQPITSVGAGGAVVWQWPASPVWTLDPAQAIVRDARAHTVRLLDGMRLDFGGVAKGWAAEQAARRLSEYGPALVEAGGDIAVSGPLADGARWPIGIADPQWPDADLEVVLIERGGVATSGRDYRRWQKDGVWQHHILDPRTGQPAVTDVLSATLIAPTTREAEVAAKVALILGSEDGLSWIETRPPLAALLVLEEGRVLVSKRLQEYVA
jgi:FAD:protein FMN transferase